MPTLEIIPNTRLGATLSDSAKISVADGVAKLRKFDSTSGSNSIDLTKDGKFHAAYFETPLNESRRLIEIYSIDVEERGISAPVGTGVDPDSKVRFALNNGTSWYYWDSSSWTVISGGSELTQTSTKGDINTNLATFPLGDYPRKVAIRVVLTPDDGQTVTPSIRRFFLNYEHDSNINEDVVRGLVKHLKANHRARLRATIPTSSDSTIDLAETGFTIFEPITCYNLTTDSGKTTDLFSSLSGTVVTLSSAQTGNIQINYRGRPNVRISSPNEFITEGKSALPQIYVQYLTRTTPSFGSISPGDFHYERNTALKTFRARRFPKEQKLIYQIIGAANNELDMLAIMAELNRNLFSSTGTLNKGPVISSVLTLNEFGIVSVTPVDYAAHPDSSVNAWAMLVTIYAVEDALDYTTGNLADTVKIIMGSSPINNAPMSGDTIESSDGMEDETNITVSFEDV